MPSNRKPRRRAVAYGNEWVRTLDRSTEWIWEGVIAEDAITVLSAPEKTGKTTLLSLLLDRRREGGRLLGRAVRPGRTILCSEENRTLWAIRQPPLNFGSQLEYHCPIGPNPTPRRWRRFINHLLTLGDTYFDLLVIDSVMSFLPHVENNRHEFHKALNELRVICNGPAGVLLIHQMSSTRNRTRARGPLTAFADILIDMRVPGSDRFTRRRCITGVGRYPGTLQRVVAELNADGTDYLLLPDDAMETAGAPCVETLRQILSASPEPPTRQEILDRWPDHEPPPRPDSLWRTLTRGCETGMLLRTGARGRSRRRFDMRWQNANRRSRNCTWQAGWSAPAKGEIAAGVPFPSKKVGIRFPERATIWECGDSSPLLGLILSTANSEFPKR